MKLLRIIVFCIFLILSNYTFAQFINYSPDGTKIVYSWLPGTDNSLLKIYDTAMKLELNIPVSDGAMYPVWSPDGKYIAFDSKLGLLKYDVAKKTSVFLDNKIKGPYVWTSDSTRIGGFQASADKPNEFEFAWFLLKENASSPNGSVPPAVRAGIFWSNMVSFDDSNGVFFVSMGSIFRMEFNELKLISSTQNVIGFNWLVPQKEIIWAYTTPNPKYVLLGLAKFTREGQEIRSIPIPEIIKPINNIPTKVPNPILVAFSPDGKRLAIVVSYTEKDKFKLACFSVPITGKGVNLVHQTALIPKTFKAASLTPVFSPDGSKLALLELTDTQASLTQYNADGTHGKELKIDKQKIKPPR